MLLALLSLGLASLMEIILSSSLPAIIRHSFAAATIFVITFGSVLLVISHPAVWTFGITILSVYRVINLFRLISDRHNPNYLLGLTRRSSIWLNVGQLLICAITFISDHYNVAPSFWFISLVIVQGVIAVIIFFSTLRHLETTKNHVTPESYADRDLPTLSVLIPARNETDELDACLKSLLASTYPKLEIIVLDDCSPNRRTPEIIRSYAHDGIRFIAGDSPPNGWLAKNFAYQRLCEEANGQYLLFCGVDTRFQPESLRNIIEISLARKKTMVSIVPRNEYPSGQTHRLAVIQPLRYAWELALPRRLFVRPPVLSTCWVIKQTIFHAAGEFKAVTRSVIPERYFARYCATHQDGYSFLQSDAELDIYSEKQLTEQRQTAIRVRYPQLHQRLELTAFVSLAELVLLLGSPISFLLALLLKSYILAGILAVIILLLIISYSRLVTLTYRRFNWQSLVLGVYAVLSDIALVNYSLYRYEFRDVIWKGRNICVPVMQVTPHLPSI
jgi:glycosyltransferase involved in cell wall biosynthesis